MEILKEILVELYPVPITVDMSSEFQIADYIKSLSGDQRKQLGKYFIEYLRSEEIRLGIDRLEERIETTDLLKYTNDMWTFRRFKETFFLK